MQLIASRFCPGQRHDLLSVQKHCRRPYSSMHKTMTFLSTGRKSHAPHHVIHRFPTSIINLLSILERRHDRDLTLHEKE